MLLITAITFALLAGLASYLRFEQLMDQQSEAMKNPESGEDALHWQMVQRISTAHRAAEPFTLIVASYPVATPAADKPQSDMNAANDPSTKILNKLSTCLRSSDMYYSCENSHVGILLDTDRDGAQTTLERLQEELNKPHSGLPNPIHLGAATHPENGAKSNDLFTAAKQAIAETQEKPDAVVSLAPFAEPERDEDEEELLEQKKQQFNKEQSAYLDPLTGVLKEEKFPTTMQKYVAKFRRKSKRMSILLLDIDMMSRYNDHYGRDGGDAIIAGMGALLQQIVREGDLIARIGGEEFAILMSCSADNAMKAGLRIINTIKRHSFAHGTKQLKVTASIGLAGMPNHGTAPKELFENAGFALKTAQEKGRSLCMMYHPSMMMLDDNKEPIDAF